MAVNVDIVYKTVLLILNQQQRGYMTPDEFNKVATQVQLTIFEGYASDLNVSAHFLVDRNGEVFQLMKDNIMARHVIGLNYSSIGIENVGGIEGYPLTNEQLISNIKLVKYLKSKYPKIDYLIGHFEYTNFENHELWLEKDSLYRTIKIDPGIEFMNKLRKDLNNLNFKELP